MKNLFRSLGVIGVSVSPLVSLVSCSSRIYVRTTYIEVQKTLDVTFDIKKPDTTDTAVAEVFFIDVYTEIINAINNYNSKEVQTVEFSGDFYDPSVGETKKLSSTILFAETAINNKGDIVEPTISGLTEFMDIMRKYDKENLEWDKYLEDVTPPREPYFDDLITSHALKGKAIIDQVLANTISSEERGPLDYLISRHKLVESIDDVDIVRMGKTFSDSEVRTITLSADQEEDLENFLLLELGMISSDVGTIIDLINPESQYLGEDVTIKSIDISKDKIKLNISNPEKNLVKYKVDPSGLTQEEYLEWSKLPGVVDDIYFWVDTVELALLWIDDSTFN